MNKKAVIAIFFLTITSVYALKDLFKRDFFSSHDGIHQVARLYYFDRALSEAQIPVRYAGNALNGFGYPLFIFNYQTPWYIAEVFYKLTNSLVWSVKDTFLVTYVLSGIFIFLWLRRKIGNLPALLAGFIYTWAPYRFSVVFVRGALGDATSFMFFPLIFWSIDNLQSRRKNIWIVLGAISLALLLLSHAMVFFLFLPMPVFYFIYNLLLMKEKRVNFIKNGVLLGVLAVLLSSFYLIPAVLEKNYTVFDSIMNVHYQDHFPTLEQLIYSKWGYGFSFSGTDKDEMSFQIGAGQWISAISFVFLTIFLILKRRIREVRIPLFFLAFFCYSIVMMLDFSKPIWILMTKLLSLDYPFRFLFMSVLSVSVLAGYVLKTIHNKTKYIFFGFLFLLTIYANRNHLRINEILTWPEDLYIKSERTTNSYDEYTPKWASQSIIKNPAKDLIQLENKGVVKLTNVAPTKIQFSVKLEKQTKLKLNKIYYPGWVVTANEKPIKINYENNEGLISFVLDKGNYVVDAYFTETKERMFSDGLTLIGLLISGLLIVKKEENA